jgi:hypothetical protein
MTQFTPTNRSKTPHLKQKTCVEKKTLDSVVASRERKEKEEKEEQKRKKVGSGFAAPTAGLDLAGHRDPRLGLASRRSAASAPWVLLR